MSVNWNEISRRNKSVKTDGVMVDREYMWTHRFFCKIEPLPLQRTGITVVGQPCLVYAMLSTEPRAPCVPGKHSSS